MLYLEGSDRLGEYEQSDMSISTLDKIKSFPPPARVDEDSIATSVIGCGTADYRGQLYGNPTRIGTQQ